MNVAVVGSRRGVDLDTVVAFCHTLWRRYGQEVILVSGGADGVDRTAETTWLGLGGSVVSFRPVQLIGGQAVEEEYGVQRWELGGSHPLVFTLGQEHPTWDSWAGAAFYRNKLIAELADRGVAFWANKSRGTADAIDAFEAEATPLHVYHTEGGADGSQS